MAEDIRSFIPQLWIGQLLKYLNMNLVSEAGVNHNYEGEIKRQGDTVKINRLGRISIGDYDGETPLVYEKLNTEDLELKINKAKKFSFLSDDISYVQAANGPGMISEAMQNASYRLAATIDNDNFQTMITGAGTTIGDNTPIDVVDAASAKALLIKIKNAADRANVPTQGRILFASHEFGNYLLGDNILGLASPTTNEVLRTGFVTRLFGMDIYASNNIEELTDDEKNPTVKDPTKSHVILTIPAATTVAIQISKMEALRDKDLFEDYIRGLVVYGNKVILPEAVTSATVVYESNKE